VSVSVKMSEVKDLKPGDVVLLPGKRTNAVFLGVASDGVQWILVCGRASGGLFVTRLRYKVPVEVVKSGSATEREKLLAAVFASVAVFESGRRSSR
jgi:hypothetical protein